MNWLYTNKGKAVVILGVIFIESFWFRSFMALLLLPLIYFVWRRSGVGVILAGVYSGILTIVNSAVYISANYNPQGEFIGSLQVLLIFWALFAVSVGALRRARRAD